MKTFFGVLFFLTAILGSTAGAKVSASEERATDDLINALMPLQQSIAGIELKANPSIPSQKGYYVDSDNAPLFQVYTCVYENSAVNFTQKCATHFEAEVMNQAIDIVAHENLAAGVIVHMLKQKDPGLFAEQRVKTIPALEDCREQIRDVRMDRHYSAENLNDAIVMGQLAGDAYIKWFMKIDTPLCAK